MTDAKLSNDIASTLAHSFRLQRADWFRTYVSVSCSGVVVQAPQFDSLVIFEAEEGDVSSGVIGSIMKHAWSLDERGWRKDAGRIQQSVADWNDAEETGRSFFRHVHMKFYRHCDLITFGEAFGPRFRCRKLGQVFQSNEGLWIRNVRLLWNANYLGRDAGFGFRDPPAQAPLDIGPNGPVMDEPN